MAGLCAIWGTKTRLHSRSASGTGFTIDSPRAGGRYEITPEVHRAVDGLEDRQKAVLTSWLVDQHRAGNSEPVITLAEVERSKVARPKRLLERRDSLLQAISENTPALGETMRYYDHIVAWSPGEPQRENPFWPQHDYLLAATESLKIAEVETLLDFARLQGLIDKDKAELSLTFAGHSHLEELAVSPNVTSQAFIAMWFGADVAEAYERGIVPAVIATGYKPMRIDRKEHNNKIDDEIIAEIRRSKFVVADFTCGLVDSGGTPTAIPRGGVYYEAGFAQGLGIPVIWCCREDHIGHVHFDTRQFNHITWKTPEELQEKLKNRIGAVIGDGPLLAD